SWPVVGNVSVPATVITGRSPETPRVSNVGPGARTTYVVGSTESAARPIAATTMETEYVTARRDGRAASGASTTGWSLVRCSGTGTSSLRRLGVRWTSRHRRARRTNAAVPSSATVAPTAPR